MNTLGTPDYIQILSHSLAARKQRNPRYSLRAFAKYLGIDPSSLSRILSGKQELSVLTCRKLVQRLDLPVQDRERFLSSVAETKVNRAAYTLSDGFAEALGTPIVRTSMAARNNGHDSAQWIEMAHDAALILDPEQGLVMDVNARACELYGFSREEFLGKSIQDLSEKRDWGVRRMREVLAQPGKYVSFESVHRKSDGGRLILEVNASVTQYRDRQAVLSLNSDITNRKATEERTRFLSEVGKLLCGSLQDKSIIAQVARLTVAGIADGCVIRIFQGNHSVESLDVAHRDPEVEERIGRFLETRLKSIDKLCLRIPELGGGRPIMNASVSDGDTADFIASLGVSSSIYAPLIVRGRSIGMICFWGMSQGVRFTEEDQDVAGQLVQRMATAVDNMWLFAEALRAVKTRDDFVAVVSHDLRNPLTGILSCSDILLKSMGGQVQETPMLRKGLDTIRHSAERMHHLVSGLLSMSKAAFLATPVEISDENVAVLLTDAILAAQPIAAKKGIRISMVNEGADFRTCCDREQILRVLSNLLGNAVKFSPENSSITVDAEAHDGEVYFSVRDEGCGIPEQQISRIFDRFWQANPDLSSGAGLGLSISRDIVTAHGGDIWVKSREGQGTTFFFRLPLTAAKGIDVA